MKQIVLLLIALPLFTLAQIPRTMSYQGILADGTGNFIPDGNHSLTLRLYETASGGSALYEESHSVAVIKGLFNAIIGSQTALPAGLSFDKAYYLGVSVDGGSELVPRAALSAVPYALYAEAAGEAKRLGVGATGAITALTSPDASISISNPTGPNAELQLADNAVTSSKITDGTIQGSDISTTGSAEGQVLTISNGMPSWKEQTVGWSLNGNAGITPDSNFIGTRDSIKLLIKTSNTERIGIESNGIMNIYSPMIAYGGLNVPSGEIHAGAIRLIHGEFTGSLFVGHLAGNANSGGANVNNTGIGTYALRSNTIGTANTAVGYHALESITTSGLSTAVGYFSLAKSTGTSNTAIGYETGKANTTGYGNLFVGNSAGTTNTTGIRNTFLGSSADATSADLTNATAIGALTKVGVSNAVVLGNNANVGIKTSSPATELHIGGKGTISLAERSDNPAGIAGVWQLYIYHNGSTYQLRVCAPNGELTNIGNLDH